MQLNDRNPTAGQLRGRLGAAVFAVLGTVTHAHPANAADDGANLDTAVLHYQENGGRVAVTEGVVHLQNTIDDDNGLDIKFTYDTLSGGSPNGALPSKTVQTFARPSGSSLLTTTAPVQTYTTASGQVVTEGGGSSGPYTVAPGQLPLDKSFHDQRYALGSDWSHDIDRVTRFVVGGNYSHELDFQSLSANGTLSRDFFEKNTTLSLGVNLEKDWIKPIGGAPVPMSDYARFEKTGDKSKQVKDLLLGVSQVISRRWITQLNFSLDRSNGYQNDPYKILSALDTSGNVIGYVFENRPNARTRRSIYWENRYAFDRDTLTLSYRYMNDDWGIKSNTYAFSYRWVFGRHFYLEPQLRYYHQSAANFFHFYLEQGQPLVPYASADPRLAAFTAKTYGLKWADDLSDNTQISARVQYYRQDGSGPSVVLPALQGLDLYPGLKAMIFQIGFKTRL